MYVELNSRDECKTASPEASQINQERCHQPLKRNGKVREGLVARKEGAEAGNRADRGSPTHAQLHTDSVTE